MIKTITIIVYSYPTPTDPVYAFIRPVACGLADCGIQVNVIAPQSITNALKRKVKIRPRMWVDYTTNGKTVSVYQPWYISISMLRYKGILLSRVLFDKAVKKVYKKVKRKTDIVYAHFWESGVAAANAIDTDNTPLVVVSGENHISVFDNYPEMKVLNCVDKVKGLICVSTKNLNECRDLHLITEDINTIVLPNAVDNRIFYKMDRKEARKKLGLNQDDVIAIFVGEFSERKGVNRLIEAAKNIPQLKLILIGNGRINTDNDQIIFSSVVSHELIPVYLSASDFFVLPTLAEGCCNAIIEAMACGLPIISSDLPFNYDVLNDENSILVDPNSIEQIADAMTKLVNDDSLCNQLSLGALKSASLLSIDKRVKKIESFLQMISHN